MRKERERNGKEEKGSVTYFLHLPASLPSQGLCTTCVLGWRCSFLQTSLHRLVPVNLCGVASLLQRYFPLINLSQVGVP